MPLFSLVANLIEYLYGEVHWCSVRQTHIKGYSWTYLHVLI